MRAYKFLSKQFGLKSLYERRLKQSRIRELNDPFELRPYDISEPMARSAFNAVREHFDRENGLICFSASWRDPVIWAHYADKHYGLCLGFEVPEITGDDDHDIAKRVGYISQPLPFPSDFQSLPLAKKKAVSDTIPFTKFEHWGYEGEIRIWGRLSKEEDGIHYLEFEERMRLVEIIIGERCTLKRHDIIRTLGTHVDGVEIRKARAAFDRFEMIEDESGAR
ncbi:MAG: DUF2971 domain-containing protein [Terriglobales bacterium]